MTMLPDKNLYVMSHLEHNSIKHGLHTSNSTASEFKFQRKLFIIKFISFKYIVVIIKVILLTYLGTALSG